MIFSYLFWTERLESVYYSLAKSFSKMDPELNCFPSQVKAVIHFFPHSKISQLLQDPPVKGGNTLFAHKLSPLIPHVLTLVQLEKAEKNKTKPTPNAPQKWKKAGWKISESKESPERWFHRKAVFPVQVTPGSKASWREKKIILSQSQCSIARMAAGGCIRIQNKVTQLFFKDCLKKLIANCGRTWHFRVPSTAFLRISVTAALKSVILAKDWA